MQSAGRHRRSASRCRLARKPMSVVEPPSAWSIRAPAGSGPHLPLWCGKGERSLESEIKRSPGVLGVQASSLTRNVLIRYDRTRTDEGRSFTRLPRDRCRCVYRIGRLRRSSPPRSRPQPTPGDRRKPRQGAAGPHRRSAASTAVRGSRGRSCRLMRNRGAFQGVGQAAHRPSARRVRSLRMILLNEIIALAANLGASRAAGRGRSDPSSRSGAPLAQPAPASVGCLIGLGNLDLPLPDATGDGAPRRRITTGPATDRGHPAPGARHPDQARRP